MGFKFVFNKKKSVLPETESEEKPRKKKVALTVIEGGKADKKKDKKPKKKVAAAVKTTKTKAKATAAPKAKRKGGNVVAGKKVAESTPKLEKLIGKVDAAFVAEEEQVAHTQEALAALHSFLEKDGKSSFKHHKLGYYCVMKRLNKKTKEHVYFWRPKPQGRG